MKNEKLQKLFKNGFPWVIVNKQDSKDYKTFLCLPSAIREIEHLNASKMNYVILPTDDDSGDINISN
jgi:hypothetical protein